MSLQSCRRQEKSSLFRIREQDQWLVCFDLRDKTSDECNSDHGTSHKSQGRVGWEARQMISQLWIEGQDKWRSWLWIEGQDKWWGLFWIEGQDEWLSLMWIEGQVTSVAQSKGLLRIVGHDRWCDYCGLRDKTGDESIVNKRTRQVPSLSLIVEPSRWSDCIGQDKRSVFVDWGTSQLCIAGQDKWCG